MSGPPLPDGWIQQHDANYDRPYWVDTRANPPRAIWVPPYEDERFLGEHPDLRADAESRTGFDPDAPPSYDAVMAQHASGSGDKPGSLEHPGGENKRGVFGRLKDKAIGTKEEREEHRRIRAEQAARAEEEARWARMRQLEEREAYMRAHGGYAPYHPSRPADGPGGDNTAALLLGGVVGGLLLGDIFGGGF